MKTIFVLIFSLFGSWAMAGVCIATDSSGVYDNYCAERTSQGQNFCEATRVCRWIDQNHPPAPGHCFSRTGNPADDANCASRAPYGEPYCEAGGMCIWTPL